MTETQAEQPSTSDGLIDRLRGEIAAAPSRSLQGILLHEVGVLHENAGEEPLAARDYLAAYNADAEFREPLAPYGNWVDDSTYGTVWVPHTSVVGADFTPYSTAGHWTYDDEWVWVTTGRPSAAGGLSSRRPRARSGSNPGPSTSCGRAVLLVVGGAIVPSCRGAAAG